MSTGLLDPEPGTPPPARGPDAGPAAGPAPAATAVEGLSPGLAWRRLRGPAAVVGAVLLLVLLTVLVGGRAREGQLDPAATTPDGARALAVLLEDSGVEVERVTTTDDALAGGARSTVAVPFPQALTDRALRALAGSPADLVVLAPSGEGLAALAPGLEVGSSTGVAVRQPACALPEAETAGAVDLGGLTYDTAGAPDAEACYEAAGGALLVRVLRPGGGTTTVLGDGEPLTNGRLASEGNAALGLLLLGGGDEVRWLLPVPGAEAPDDERGLVELLPASVRTALLLVAAAAVLTALWRARRLGPVVAEPLPVVVRAAETVEGRARLYRAARARDRAAESLRAASRARLAPLAGAGRDPAPGGLVTGVAGRAGLTEAEVGALLYGPVPADDPGLVRLASDLDGLEGRVRAGGVPAAAPSAVVPRRPGPPPPGPPADPEGPA